MDLEGKTKALDKTSELGQGDLFPAHLSLICSVYIEREGEREGETERERESERERERLNIYIYTI